MALIKSYLRVVLLLQRWLTEDRNACLFLMLYNMLMKNAGLIKGVAVRKIWKKLSRKTIFFTKTHYDILLVMMLQLSALLRLPIEMTDLGPRTLNTTPCI